jgi:VanZ family protein
MIFMFSLSTDHFSSAHTAPFTTILLLKFIPGLRALGVETIDLLVRKVAHLSEYFIFAILLTRALNNRSSLSTKRQIIWGIVLGVMYAVSDEVHQSFVPSRSASAVDVVIDTIAFVCGTFSFYTHVAIRQVKTVHANRHPRA